MRPLVLYDKSIEKIKRVKEYAAAHPFSEKDMDAIRAGRKRPAGDNIQFVCHIPVGFRAVYSEETMAGRRLRRMSISVDSSDSHGPNPHAVFAIAKEFGFKATGVDDPDTFFYIDDEPYISVCLVEAIDGNLAEIVDAKNMESA